MTMPNTMPSLDSDRRLRWYEGMTRYHWWVLIIGSMAWLFDTMDQRIFVLCRQPALSELQNLASNHPDVIRYGKYVTAVMIAGWAVGGLFFGIMGDRWGRVKTLSVSILVYSCFTGLSGLSAHWWDFCVYRFMMGCGIGGAFATSATLIAETLPTHSRAFALGTFQALSAIGNITGSAIARYVVVPDIKMNLFGQYFAGWRVLFFFGVVPAFLVVFIIRTIREPEAWVRAKAAAAQTGQKHGMGDIGSMLSHRTWRRNLLVGTTLAVAGVVGLWGVGFWTPELINEALKSTPTEQVARFVTIAAPESQAAQEVETALTAGDQEEARRIIARIIETAGETKSLEGIAKTARGLDSGRIAAVETRVREAGPAAGGDVLELLLAAGRARVGRVKASATLWQDVGAFLGIFAFTVLATTFGRRISFALSLFTAYAVVVFVFWNLSTASQAYWMAPMVGFATLSIFGGYAIYFPEIFPARLRSTGTGLCYNSARIFTVVIILGSTQIDSWFRSMQFSSPFRAGAIAVASIYVIGLIALIWAPETKDQPLPEDEPASNEEAVVSTGKA